MTLPASTMLMSVPVLDVEAQEALFERLPAQARARVTWAKRPIEDGLVRLQTQPLTDDLVAEIADGIWAPIQAIGLAGWETITKSHGESRAVLMDEIHQDEELLADFLPDEDARDTLRWVVGLLRSFFDVLFAPVASVPAESLAQARAEDVARAAASAPEIQPFTRGIVALMAAVRVAKDGGDPDRAAELLNVSFLQLRDLRNMMRRHGVSLSAFPDEPVEERRQRLLEAATRLRKSFSDDDWRVLDEARMHDLR